MVRRFAVGALGATVALTAGAVRSNAQSLGTFKWQLQPYCNVVTVTISPQGGVYALDGMDDQCGAGKLAATDGTAFLNTGTTNSSGRFKEDIQDLGAAGDEVLGLRPVQFRSKTPAADGTAPVQYGLIAEEVSEVMPELVSRSADREFEAVQYQVLPALRLAQVQRLAAFRASTPGVTCADPRQK